jgi:hypothetical protein
VNLNPVTETFQNEDQRWLGSAHGTDAAQSITLDTSVFTAGTHYPNGYFPSGLPLGRITATGKYGPYNNALADGTETLVGFLFCTVDAPTDNTQDPQGAILLHGRVIESFLPVAIDAAGRVDVAGRIILV